MHRFAVALIFALIAWQSIGSSAEIQSVCQLEDPPKQCGEFCLTVLQPILDHIAKHQEQWSNCSVRQAGELLARLDKIESLQSAIHVKQKVLQASWESPALPKDFEERLERIEGRQAELLKGISKVDRKTVPARFELIGSRFFYVEEELRRNWSSAAITCRRRGAQLAVIEGEEELKALRTRLNKERSYWLDINDLDTEGQFKSSATGKEPPFYKWRAGQPNNFDGKQHCVDLLDGLMYDNKCDTQRYFICQSDSEN
ncbi:accessory gland protein Acp29AB [Drosophila ficusphila]|uniref:accessory gland protein Acp29AB n=1 Tax=Drosophila ficusphila TaxID=30025 RepID=UPI0007E80BBC|nr:accessory gland protein Acp29AB [Drosophila ficusphila]